MLFNPLFSGSDPFGEMHGLLRRMDELFRDFGVPTPDQGLFGEMWPPIQIDDSGDELILRADVPGLTEKDISIEATQDTLTLRGEKKVQVPDGYTVHRQERRPLRFTRTIALPSRIDLDNVEASVSNGVLTLQLSRIPEERPRQIAVKSS
jgi:HSP20 family protein